MSAAERMEAPELGLPGGVLEGFPVSAQQQHLWRLMRDAAGAVFPYVASCSVRIDGPLCRQVLRRELAGWIGRHEILRTTFSRLPGVPLPIQVVHAPFSPALPAIDLAALAAVPEAQVRALAALAEGFARLPFDLDRGPLLRLALAVLSSDRHELLATLPTLCADEASLRLLAAELAAGVESGGGGGEAAGEPLQYADFCQWQSELLAAEETAAAQVYWQEQAAAALRAVRLPGERTAKSPFVPRAIDLGVGTELAAGIAELALLWQVPLAAVLLASWQVLLWRATGERELAVGVAADGRRYAELERAVGLFARALPVAARLAEEMPFPDLVARAETALRDAAERQDLFSWDDLAPAAEAEPFAPFAFAWDDELAASGRPPSGIRFAIARPRACADRYLLRLSAAAAVSGAPFGLALGYDAGRLAPSMALRLGEETLRLLESIHRAPASALADLPFLGDGERHRLLAETAGPAAAYPRGRCIHQWIEEQVERTPAALAVAAPSGRLSYRELDLRARRLALSLRALGIGPEAKVALCAGRAPDLVVGIYGILKAGGAYVPLDPDYPSERVAAVLADAGVDLLLCEERLAASFSRWPGRLLTLEAGQAAEAASAEALRSSEVGPGNLAYVLYTSGSTGKPKGVMVTHENVVASTAARLAFYPEPVSGFFLASSFAFDSSVAGIFWTLCSGGALHLPVEGFQHEPERLAEILARQGVSHLLCLPALYDLLLRHGDPAHLAGLRSVIVAGETCPRELVGRHFRRLPEVPLYNEYGPTEATVWTSVHRCSRGDEAGPVPIGRPIANCRVYLLDGALQPVSAGVAGELCVAGPGVVRGYLGAPEATAASFLPDLAGRGERLYRTGDLARWREDGWLEFLGRRDGQVKVRGFRIEPTEVEAALAAHPGVRAAAVALRRDALGEGRLVGYYEVGEAAPAVEELRAHLRRRLPEPMVPALLVAVAHLPRTPSGKLDRGALPAPDLGRPTSERDVLAPRNGIEALLAGIWAEVLRLPRVGVEHSFFDLGGDSISAVRLRVKAQQSGLSFSVQQLFAHPTIAELATVLAVGGAASRGAEAAPPGGPFSLLAREDLLRLPGDAEDAYPLAMLQLGMLVHGELGRADALYHDVVSLLVTAPWNPEALRSTLRQLAALHPVLRTSFHLSAYSEPIQVVRRAAEIPLAVVDLRGLAEPLREREVAAWLDAEKNHPFAWEEAPLLRVTVHLLTAAIFHFGLAEHHAILDGWSASILLAELFESYMEGVAGRAPAARTPPGAGFRDFVGLERQALASEATRSFWSARLAGAEQEPFPRWDARPAPGAAAPLHQEQVPVGAALSARLHRFAAALGVPVKSVLLAAHLRSLSLASGRRELITGLMAHGRPEEEGGDRALGLFLNSLPLRFRLDGGSWAELARATFAAEQELLPHRRYPFARLQQEHGRRPLFETVFNFVHFHLLAGLRGAAGVEVRGAPGHERTNFPLAAHASLAISDSRVGLLLLADGREIGTAQLKALAGIYARTLEAMVDDPRALYELAPILSPAESHQLLAEWNDTRAELPAALSTAHELVAAQARLHPQRAAVVQGGETMLYGELERRSSQLAHALVAAGAGPGARVGICLPPRPELLIALLAVLETGSAYVPLDPAGPPARLAFQVADSGLSWVLTLDELAPALPAGVPIFRLDADRWPAAAKGPPALPAAPESLAYVLYTSGSTGEPKGVMVAHRNLSAAIAARLAAYPRPVERWLLLLPFTFDGSLTPIFGTLATGGTLCLPPPGAERDPAGIAQAIAQARVTHLLSLPSWYQQILAAAAVGQLGSLTTCLVAGEPCPPGLPALHCELLPGCALVNEYGPTEATIWCTLHRAGGETGAAVPIGRPIANARALVLDDFLQPAPVGAPGEIWIGGAGVAVGYLDRPDLTADRFRPDPFSGAAEAGGRLFKSGDLGRRRPDGEIEFLGRRDHQVKVRGFRVELGEIESALAEHPAVGRVAAIVREPAGSPEDRRLVACFEARRSGPGAAELREFLKPRLPAYMIPASFVRLPELPLSAAGKVDRRALQAAVESAEKAAEASDQGPAAAPPRDSLELQLLQIWEEVLAVRPIGVRDDFFDIGGHSLLGVSLVSRIESRLGVALPLTALFEAPTIERLAEMLRRPTAAPPLSPFVPLQPTGHRPPLICIHPGGGVLCYVELARRLGPDQPVYGIESPLLHGSGAAGAGLAALAAGHVEILRRSGSGPYRLAGWSVGGVIAFEMAVQLVGAGERVAELILFDSRAPSPPAAGLEPAEIAARFGLDLLGRRLPDPPFSYEEFRQLGAVERVRRILAAARAAGVLAADAGEEQVQRRLDVFDDTIRRVAGYAPTGYPGSLTLVRAQGSGGDGAGDPTLGWERLAERGVEVVWVPGDHYSLLEPPEVELVADQVKRCLERSADASHGESIPC